MKEKIKKNYKVAIVFFVLGIIVSGLVVYAATQISSTNVSYDNSTSGLSSTTLKGAIDELYEKSDIRKLGNFVSAYTYNQTSGASNYCVTGEESTCKKSTCYKTKTANSCKAGDIIKYKVNDTDIVTFHVMYDNGSTLTMQSQKNTLSDIQWINKEDYVAAGGAESNYGNSGSADKGPITALKALESATSGWSNVKEQEYTMGTTVFATNAYTGCLSSGDTISCTINHYTLTSRKAKARMITLQEAVGLGCTQNNQSCPKWMYSSIAIYWTMSAYPNLSDTWCVGGGTGKITGHYSPSALKAIRAVIEVSK